MIDVKELQSKLRQIHPEIDKYGLGLVLDFDQTKNAWIVKMTKGEHSLETHIEAEDAEKCLGGVECVHLGVQVGQFVKNYCEAGKECSV